MNVAKKSGFSQVCVIQGVPSDPCLVREFEEILLQIYGTRVQYLEEFITPPSANDDGCPVPGQGTRSDHFFAVHNDDLSGFSTRRLLIGARWVEDILWSVNYKKKIYPDRVFGYRTWDPEPDDIEDAELLINKIYYDHLRPPSVRNLSTGMLIVRQHEGGQPELHWVPRGRRS